VEVFRESKAELPALSADKEVETGSNIEFRFDRVFFGYLGTTTHSTASGAESGKDILGLFTLALWWPETSALRVADWAVFRVTRQTSLDAAGTLTLREETYNFSLTRAF
jgi:hypothetical protein